MAGEAGNDQHRQSVLYRAGVRFDVNLVDTLARPPGWGILGALALLSAAGALLPIPQSAAKALLLAALCG
nr:hypothetical protein [Succinivibrionaceae bacterium]